MDDIAFPLEPDVDRLVAEIERYLAVVDALRSEGLEPAWAPEGAPTAMRLVFKGGNNAR